MTQKSERRVSISDAIAQSRGPAADWAKVGKRLVPEAWPEIRPSFTVGRGSAVFTIGSCFARNIEEDLERLGFDVPTRTFTAPAEESARTRPNALLNKYTPPSIEQELAWVSGILERDGRVTEADCAAFAYELDDGRVVDTNLATYVPVTRERFVQRRREVYAVFTQAFTAECVTITLGLVEAWFDRKNGNYVAQPPVGKLFRRDEGRFEFEVLGYEDCRARVQSSIDLVRRRNPGAKFLITTSPVPLARTFTSSDVLTANLYSKSVLRAVAGGVADCNDGVDYFPAYESVMLTRSSEPWELDQRHVAQHFVGSIVQRLAAAYFTDAAPGPRCFQEARAAFGARDVARASASIEEALRHHPESGPYHLLAGKIALERREHDCAREHLLAAAADGTSAADAYHHLSHLLDAGAELDAACAAATRAVELRPSSQPFRLRLAQLLEKAGDAESAFAQLEAARGLKRSHHVHGRLGQLLVRMQRHEDALEHFNVAASLAGPFHRAAHLVALVDALLALERYEEAETCAAGALRESAGSQALQARLLVARQRRARS